MNVSELIEKLQAVDPKLVVGSEGCDCTGPAWGVDVYQGTVTITRADAWVRGRTRATRAEIEALEEQWHAAMPDLVSDPWERPETEIGNPPPGGDPPWTGGRPMVGGR